MDNPYQAPLSDIAIDDEKQKYALSKLQECRKWRDEIFSYVVFLLIALLAMFGFPWVVSVPIAALLMFGIVRSIIKYREARNEYMKSRDA